MEFADHSIWAPPRAVARAFRMDEPGRRIDEIAVRVDRRDLADRPASRGQALAPVDADTPRRRLARLLADALIDRSEAIARSGLAVEGRLVPLPALSAPLALVSAPLRRR